MQVPFTVALAFAVFTVAAALVPGTGIYPVLYMALACGFSSTLLVVKVLQDRLQIDTVDGACASGC